ncbi:MAG: hypothetical protein R2712_02845 [Vicinamibacterales bacterium]
MTVCCVRVRRDRGADSGVGLRRARRGAAACGDPPRTAARIRRRFLAGAAARTGVVLLVGQSGWLREWDRRPPPMMLLLVAILGLGVLIARSTAGDRLARGLSLPALVALQGFRLPLELLMHETAAAGIMPAQMTYSGLNFDIVSGVTAIGLAAWMTIRTAPRGVVVAWNVLGLVLLANIVTIAVLSTPTFAVFGEEPGRLNTFVTRPPYVLLPAIMVLAAWAGHLVVFRALAARPGVSPRRP